MELGKTEWFILCEDMTRKWANSKYEFIFLCAVLLELECSSHVTHTLQSSLSIVPFDTDVNVNVCVCVYAVHIKKYLILTENPQTKTSMNDERKTQADK